jgi:hypothetical protein
VKFEDLPATHPAPALKPALNDVYALRDKHYQLNENVTALERQIRDVDSPSVRAADDEIRELRARADPDRPYLLAVQNVVAEWSDAEEEYDGGLAHVEWARARLETLTATPNADPLDVAAAKADVELLTMLLPATPPAERFQPALTHAMQTRAGAAGGAEKIVSGGDVDAFLAGLRAADRRTLTEARAECRHVGIELDRAEATAAWPSPPPKPAAPNTSPTSWMPFAPRSASCGSRAATTPNGPCASLPQRSARCPAPTDSALAWLAELPFTITPSALPQGPHHIGVAHPP